MDMVDLKIINELKDNGRATSSEISKKVNLSIPAVAERIRKMEERGIIEKYTVKVNRESLELNLLAFIFVNIDNTENIDNFRQSIIKEDLVLECHHIAGEYDYLLKVLVKDTKTLEYFLSKKLKKIIGVSNSNTFIVLSSLKEDINI